MLTKSRNKGKIRAWVLQLQANIKSGLDCTVMTLNPIKTQEDFKMITGEELKLIKIQDSNNAVYTATIINKNKKDENNKKRL